MTRICFIATFLIVSAMALGIGTGYSAPRIGIVVSAAEAANIRGGQCGKFQLMTNAACTDAESDTCTSSTSDCDGLCPLQCSPTSTYSGAGTFTGSLVARTCDTALQANCTLTLCSVPGGTEDCCQCLNASQVQCGPAPFDLNPQGCSGT